MPRFSPYPRLWFRFGIISLLLSAGLLFTVTLAQATSVAAVPQSSVHILFKPSFPSYTILPVAGAGGSLFPGTPQTVNAGASITFTVVPSTGHYIRDVGVDGVSLGAVISYAFRNITASHFITAAFSPYTYLITPTVVGGGGVITPSGPQTVTYGSSQAFQFVPNAYYHVVGVWVDGIAMGALNAYTFTNVVTNHTLTATFAPDVFVITPVANPTAWGTIIPGGPQTVTNASALTFFIAPNTGYMIADVVIDGVSVGPVVSYTFRNVSANRTFTATFVPLNYRLVAVVVGSGGTVTPTGVITVAHGSTQTFYINPNLGYHLNQVAVDGSLLPTPVPIYTFTNINNNHSLTATFAINTFNITPTAGANGAISPNVPQTVAYGSSLTFTIAPDASYQVANVWVDGVAQGPRASYVFTEVKANHTLSAAFVPDGPVQLTIIVVNAPALTGSVAYGGNICHLTCTLDFAYNTPVTLTAFAERFKFLGWAGGCSGTTYVCALTMTAPQTVTAYFDLYRVNLPLLLKPCLTSLPDTANNTLAEAKGALCSGQLYQAQPEDQSDWWYFDVPITSSIAITMTDNAAVGVALLLRDAANNLLGSASTQPVFQITCANVINTNCTPGAAFAPGRYYLEVYAASNFITLPYSLTVLYRPVDTP